MYKFNSTANVRDRKKSYEVPYGDRITESAGYIPAKKRIEQMIQAGQRLADWRKSQYDFPDGNEVDIGIDPSRVPNFDMADASRILRQKEQKQAAAQAAAKVAPDVSKQVSETSKDVSEGEVAPE